VTKTHYKKKNQSNSAKHSGTRHAAKHPASKNTMHQLQHTHASKGSTYILTEDNSFLIKKSSTPDDGHIGQNM
jgi:hypothetical protein